MSKPLMLATCVRNGSEIKTFIHDDAAAHNAVLGCVWNVLILHTSPQGTSVVGVAFFKSDESTQTRQLHEDINHLIGKNPLLHVRGDYQIFRKVSHQNVVLDTAGFESITRNLMSDFDNNTHGN